MPGTQLNLPYDRRGRRAPAHAPRSGAGALRSRHARSRAPARARTPALVPAPARRNARALLEEPAPRGSALDTSDRSP